MTNYDNDNDLEQTSMFENCDDKIIYFDEMDDKEKELVFFTAVDFIETDISSTPTLSTSSAFLSPSCCCMFFGEIYNGTNKFCKDNIFNYSTLITCGLVCCCPCVYSCSFIRTICGHTIQNGLCYATFGPFFECYKCYYTCNKNTNTNTGKC